MNNAPLSRNDMLSALTVFALAMLLIVLFLSNKAQWQNQIGAAQHRADSLEKTLMAKYLADQRLDSLQYQKVRENFYDPRVSSDFRMYGLFKDRDGIYDVDMLAERFNITNAKSIKLSEVEGEKWYIIPVKGVHYVRPGESATLLAQRYYARPADSTLIREFNGGTIRAYSMVFVPYDK